MLKLPNSLVNIKLLTLSSCQTPRFALSNALTTKTIFIMSKHSSLKAQGSAQGKRSVMKRFERVKALKERGQWAEGQSPTGLPKTKVTE